MTTQEATNHARIHYQTSPGTEREARQRLLNILTALRLGRFEDAANGLAKAADYVAESEFSSTQKYTDLLQFEAEMSGNETWQTIAERAFNATNERRREYARAITDPDLDPPDAIEIMHQLCCDDFNARMDMIIACPQIYTESRLRR